MVFINERISAEDAKKYGIDEINNDFVMAPGSAYHWTIDRDKNVYFRWMKGNREEPKEQQVSLFWKGSLFHIDFKVTGRAEKTVDGWKGWTDWSWNGMRRPKNPNDQIILDKHRQEIIADLKEALTTYKDAGDLSRLIESTTTFDF